MVRAESLYGLSLFSVAVGCLLTFLVLSYIWWVWNIFGGGVFCTKKEHQRMSLSIPTANCLWWNHYVLPIPEIYRVAVMDNKVFYDVTRCRLLDALLGLVPPSYWSSTLLRNVSNYQWTLITSQKSWPKCINKIQQDATVCRYLFTASLLYMFRASIAPIIRSTKNCNCSLWYRSYYVTVQRPSAVA